MLPEPVAVTLQVSEALEQLNVPYRVEPQLPPDVLGIYVYLPKI